MLAIWNPFASHDPLVRALLGVGELVAFAILVLVITLFVARWGSHRLRFTLQRAGFQTNIAILLARAAWIGVWAAGIFVVLYELGVNPTPLAALIGILGLAASLSLQAVLQNLVAGIYLLAERPFKIGDRIAVIGPAGANHVGTVEDIQMRTTHLRGTDNELILVPNSSIFSGVITNRTWPGGHAEHLTIVFPRSTSVEPVRDTVLRALMEVSGVLGQPSPQLRVDSVEKDWWTASLTFWVSDDDTASNALWALSQRYPEANVSVPAGAS